MIDKYYNGVIEQVYRRVGKEEKNIVLASYYNDFSIAVLKNLERYQKRKDNVYIAWHEFEHGTLAGAYAPFLDVICDMYRLYVNEDFATFLEECGVYELQKPLFLSYYENGICERREDVLLNEVAYEQGRMTKAIAQMLRALAKVHPLVIVINRFQMTGRSTMELVCQLIDNPSKNIGLVLGVSEMRAHISSASDVWDKIVERLRDDNRVYSIGNSGRQKIREKNDSVELRGNYADMLSEIKNIIGFLDYEQAEDFFQKVEQKLKFEDASMDDAVKHEYYILYARNSILLGELSKALEMVSEAAKITQDRREHFYRWECNYLKATGFMYQGKLEEAEMYASLAKKEAEEYGDEKLIFRSEILAVTARMSGWYNIFYFLQDIQIDDSLIEKMKKYQYNNYLAHVYIYAYDNKPEVLEQAYHRGELPYYLDKGVTLAKEIGNEQLVNEAYQKNIMLAAYNGMNEIAMQSLVRNYQFMETYDDVLAGRTFSAMGYNLSAMCRNDESEPYYNRAIEIFYHLQMLEEAAEVYYNRSLSYVMQERYKEAENDLQLILKIVEKLHLNSLRVVNLSKLYALLALVSILQHDSFNCERYLLNCSQFLNYVIEKEKQNAEMIHDFAKCDDDLFLYHFAMALLKQAGGENEEALSDFERAETFLEKTEGNQFFSYRIFHEKKMELYKEMEMKEGYEQEKELLEQRKEHDCRMRESFPKDLLAEVDMSDYRDKESIPEEDIESLIKQEAILREYAIVKDQMEFVASWQKLIDVNDQDILSMVQNAIGIFENHFNLDCALYICCHKGNPNIFYNDTGLEIPDSVLRKICQEMEDTPQGIVVSKIGDGFLEHQDIISYFGVDNVCSFVAVPYVRNDKLTSLLIAYVYMKDNWHGSIERYMLNESDLNFYRLLFREMEHSIKRMEANQRVHEVNRKLQMAASTDMLTGIYNRTGMYEEIRRKVEQIRESGKPQGMGLMFIDLDNFKHYNDTYGHDIGDLVLKEMAAIFQETTKERGFVSRFGGDEFIIILDTDEKQELEAIAKEIYAQIYAREGFKKQIEKHLGHEVVMNQERLITCSIGIARAKDVRKAEDVDSLINKADDLLYTVKTGEKGHYAFL